MKWLLLFALAACGGREPVDLEGPYACGPRTCATGEMCMTWESGSQCQVNEDAGIGQYQEYDWQCFAPPKECDGIPSCDCVHAGPFCGVSDDGRTIHTGCI
jgi:hypothetical protein